MNGDAQLDLIIARIRELPKLAQKSAPDVADAVEAELRKTIAAGTTPDGTPWAARKRDGGQPLQHAAQALRVGVVDTTIVVTLSGPEARHHLGAARGKTKRRVIPIGAVPPPMAAAIREVLDRNFQRAVRGEL